MRSRGLPSLCLVLSLTLLVLACGGSSNQAASDGGAGGRPTILVLAASDLRPAFEALAPIFQSTCGCNLKFSFGSSGMMATQIEQGIPADAFFSADVAYVDALVAKGLALGDSRSLYAVGRIALATPKNGPVSVSALKDLLDARVTKVSIANPEHAPYGLAASQALQKEGIWEAVRAKLVLGENAAQATQYVLTGDAAAGIIPLSLAIQYQDRLNFALVDQSRHEPLEQAASVLASSRHREVAKQWVGFISSPQGREIMKKFGFQPPL